MIIKKLKKINNTVYSTDLCEAFNISCSDLSLLVAPGH